MTLRAKIIAYFIALHVVLAAAAVFVLLGNRLLLFVVEALFVLSVIISYRLVSALFVPLDLIRTGAELNLAWLTAIQGRTREFLAKIPKA